MLFDLVSIGATKHTFDPEGNIQMSATKLICAEEEPLVDRIQQAAVPTTLRLVDMKRAPDTTTHPKTYVQTWPQAYHCMKEERRPKSSPSKQSISLFPTWNIESSNIHLKNVHSPFFKSLTESDVGGILL